MSFCKSNKKGFTYIVAIGMLGLIAFMGLFLMQSSSAEYSQTSISVYRTMARQLAEAAAEEAAVMLEERFKDKTSTGFFDQLLLQASTSKPMRVNNSTTGLNPSFLNDFTDLKNKVTQTLALRDYHVSRVGFVIEKILPTIKDLRPIPQGPLDFDSCYYRPTDRAKPFDSGASKDWYCTLQIDVTISLERKHKISINYRLSKDIKIVNVGPIARNYTYYSILGNYINNYSSSTDIQIALRNKMNANPSAEEGRLILWNMPFQSRVFLHGPAIINLENPNLSADPVNFGAYNNPPNNEGPGPNLAFQYSKTFYGLSYFPDVSRCLFPKKKWWSHFFGGSTPTMEDMSSINANYGALFKNETVKGGKLPEKDKSLWEGFKDMFSEGVNDSYFVGRSLHQKFLPAGPFCRTPWRYVAPTPDSSSPSWANIKAAPACAFPETDRKLRLEHRWNPDDDSVSEKTQIYSSVYAVKYNQLTGNISSPNPEESEFSLSYYNNPDTEGFFNKLVATFGSIGSGLVNVITLPVQGISCLVSPLINKIFGNNDTAIDADEETQFANLFPTNFKYNYMGVVTRRLKDETEIPLSPEGHWYLNGIYWLDSLTINAPITYEGTGTLVVCRYVKDKPLTIKGDVLAYRKNGVPQGHMNIIYNPVDNDFAHAMANNDIKDRMLVIDGEGITIEASVYSCCGIRCEKGANIKLSEFPSKGMDPSLSFDKWGQALDNVTKDSNCIFGNYINYYMTLDLQKNDLWVVHNYQNSFYYEQYGSDKNYVIVQDLIDSDENKRKAYEKKSHEFFMSPKIQHIGVGGAL